MKNEEYAKDYFETIIRKRPLKNLDGLFGNMKNHTLFQICARLCPKSDMFNRMHFY